eukprot:3119553-Pleurochrysis_carterae.AAC.4
MCDRGGSEGEEARGWRSESRGKSGRGDVCMREERVRGGGLEGWRAGRDRRDQETSGTDRIKCE